MLLTSWGSSPWTLVVMRAPSGSLQDNLGRGLEDSKVAEEDGEKNESSVELHREQKKEPLRKWRRTRKRRRATGTPYKQRRRTVVPPRLSSKWICIARAMPRKFGNPSSTLKVKILSYLSSKPLNVTHTGRCLIQEANEVWIGIANADDSTKFGSYSEHPTLCSRHHVVTVHSHPALEAVSFAKRIKG
ncbi:hypothetical protein Dimus_022609 [Dionaea muscipula]